MWFIVFEMTLCNYTTDWREQINTRISEVNFDEMRVITSQCELMDSSENAVH